MSNNVEYRSYKLNIAEWWWVQRPTEVHLWKNYTEVRKVNLRASIPQCHTLWCQWRLHTHKLHIDKILCHVTSFHCSSGETHRNGFPVPFFFNWEVRFDKHRKLKSLIFIYFGWHCVLIILLSNLQSVGKTFITTEHPMKNTTIWIPIDLPFFPEKKPLLLSSFSEAV
jgi:hypothetical protein